MTIVIDTEIIALFRIQWWHLQCKLDIKVFDLYIQQGLFQKNMQRFFDLQIIVIWGLIDYFANQFKQTDYIIMSTKLFRELVTHSSGSSCCGCRLFEHTISWKILAYAKPYNTKKKRYIIREVCYYLPAWIMHA